MQLCSGAICCCRARVGDGHLYLHQDCLITGCAFCTSTDCLQSELKLCWLVLVVLVSVG